MQWVHFLIVFIELHFREYPIPDIKHERLNTKSMANLVTRLAKRFKLDKHSCPRTNYRQSLGSLRYLMHRKYGEKAVGAKLDIILCLPPLYVNITNAFSKVEDRNWDELIEIAVGESTELQVELINLLCDYRDDDAAVKWVIRFSLPDEAIPYYLVDLVKTALSSTVPTWVTIPLFAG